ncbi:MAG: hypothetical protein IJ759_03170 [Bacteroidales bacterium]|nr:hypothetical protein [Bacteroidales bacterium]
MYKSAICHLVYYLIVYFTSIANAHSGADSVLLIATHRQISSVESIGPGSIFATNFSFFSPDFKKLTIIFFT